MRSTEMPRQEEKAEQDPKPQGQAPTNEETESGQGQWE